MRFFAYDGPVERTIRYMVDMVILNLCFILCSLPVFTFGAAVTALYAVFLNETLETGMIRHFFRAFRENFRKATKIWLIYLLISLPLAVTAVLITLFDIPGSPTIRIVLMAAGVLYLSAAAFAYPLQAHFENPVGQTVRNSFALGFGMLLRGIVMTVLSFLPVAVFCLWIEAFPKVLLAWLLAGFSVSACINAQMLKKVFKRFLPESAPEEDAL